MFNKTNQNALFYITPEKQVAHTKRTRNYIKQTKALGRSSIYNIINNPELRFNEKVAFIRHNYCYYEGNYELFYNKDGTPNELRIKLDTTIKEIIMGKTSPSVLNSLNKEILKILKETTKQKENQERAELEEFNNRQQAMFLRSKTFYQANNFMFS